MPELLEAEVVELLASMDSFFIQQRVRMIEAITQGCWEQPNVYDVFDKESNKRIMVSHVMLMLVKDCIARRCWVGFFQIRKPHYSSLENLSYHGLPFFYIDSFL